MKKIEGLIEDFKGLKSEIMTTFNTRIWGTITYAAIVAGISSSNLENFVLGREIQVVKYIFSYLLLYPYYCIQQIENELASESEII